ncbi:MAG: hypothetical protein IT265_05990 [Saprospiraceae bacterium]|nr:hypothetical protein [Saprospiraceae bacterium]
MKSKSILILVALFGVLGAASYFVIQNKNTKSTIDTSDRAFAIKDIESVHKIFMTSKKSQSITLEKINNQWIVNGKYKAFANPIKNLLEAIQYVTILSIPPKEAYSYIMNDLATIGLKVEIYGPNNTPLKTYYIGGVNDDESGVYFLMDNARQPYTMYMNRGTSNIRHRYEIPLDDWRDRSLFAIPSSEIEGIDVQFPHDPLASFRISKTGKQFQMFANSTEIKTISSKKIESYVGLFETVNTEAFENLNENRSMISTMLPYCRIGIKQKDKQDSLIVSLYPINDNVDQLVDLSPEFLNQKKFFRFFANRSDGDFLILQYSQIASVLKTQQELMLLLAN